MTKLTFALALILALTTSSQALADVITCHFTEPFISTTYTLNDQSLTITTLGENAPAVIKDVSFQILGPGQFELTSKEGKTLQKLDLNFKGNNGMSDDIYPYEARYEATGRTLYGGCQSLLLKMKRSP